MQALKNLLRPGSILTDQSAAHSLLPDPRTLWPLPRPAGHLGWRLGSQNWAGLMASRPSRGTSRCCTAYHPVKKKMTLKGKSHEVCSSLKMRKKDVKISSLTLFSVNSTLGCQNHRRLKSFHRAKVGFFSCVWILNFPGSKKGPNSRDDNIHAWTVNTNVDKRTYTLFPASVPVPVPITWSIRSSGSGWGSLCPSKIFTCENKFSASVLTGFSRNENAFINLCANEKIPRCLPLHFQSFAKKQKHKKYTKR